MRRLLWVGCAILLGPACSEDPLLQQAHPTLVLDTAELDFGPVAEGTTATRNLSISNAGPVPLTLTLALAPGATPELTVRSATAAVPARAAIEIELRYTPVDPGSDTAELIVGSDDPEHREARVRVRGGPIAPRLEVSPDPVDFGPALTLRSSRPVALKNRGLATLHLAEVRVDADANRDFTLRAPPATDALGPLGETEIVIDYTRSGRGGTGHLVVRSDDPDAPELIVRLLPDPLRACEDGEDNDGDLLVDFPDDPGCTSATDGDETNPPECEDDATMPCGTDAGECELGLRTCVGRTWGPCVQPRGPTAEVCDGLDNDCDLRVDEELSETCMVNGCTGARACVESSRQAGGEWTACIAASGTPEVCDGVDNDCDGTIDDGILEGCVVNGCMGQHVCVPGGMGEFTACQVMTSAEVCNGVDDDCNGTPDDGIADLSCGVGACRRTAVGCVGGTPGTCTPGVATAEVCNGLDDDCNGTPTIARRSLAGSARA